MGMSIKITDDSIIPVGIFFILCMTVVFFVLINLREHTSRDFRDIEMAKAGLVQKVEDSQVIWVRQENK